MLRVIWENYLSRCAIMKSLAIAYVTRQYNEASICHSRNDDLHRR